ncbi:MAG: YadA-like family protein [Alphaproteobacteria bacterium]|nr:YadA-like family protein [Alphaproteobacteria bacterium]
MKYSRTAIGLLTAQYRSVLKKCLMINLGLFALGAVATATPANATDIVYNETVWPTTGETLNIGTEGDNVTISTASDGIVALKSFVNVTGDNVNISTTYSGDNSGAVWAQNRTTTSTDPVATVNIVANAINIQAPSSLGVVAMSQGIVNIEGDTTINAKKAILARGNAQVNVNTNDDSHKTVINGDIVFDYDQDTSGTPIDAYVDVNLAGAESSWTGNTYVDWDTKPADANKLNVKNSTVTLSDGATWNATKITNNDIDSDGSRYTALNNLNVDGGNVNFSEAGAQVEIDNLKVGENGVDITKYSDTDMMQVNEKADFRNGVADDHASNINVADGASIFVDADSAGNLIDDVSGNKASINLDGIQLASIMDEGAKISTGGYNVSNGKAANTLKAYYQTVTEGTGEDAGKLILGAKQGYTDLIGILQNGNYIKAYDAADADNTSVAANLTALDNQVFANATAIDTNTANIATNADNIATNTAAIAGKQDTIDADHKLSSEYVSGLGSMAAANTADYETKAVAEDKYQTKAAMSDYSTTAQANALYAGKSIETTVSGHTADINSLKTTVGAPSAGSTPATGMFATLESHTASISDLNTLTSSHTASIANNTSAIQTLNGDVNTPNSVRQLINANAAGATYSDTQTIAQAIASKQATLAAGSNIQLSEPNADTGIVTISATDTTYAAGSGITITGDDNTIAVSGVEEANLGDTLKGTINGKATLNDVATAGYTKSNIAESDTDGVYTISNGVTGDDAVSSTFYNKETVDNTFATQAALADYAKLDGNNYADSGLRGKVDTQISGAFTSRTADVFTPDDSKTVNENIASWSDDNADKFANVGTTFGVFNYKLNEVQSDINTALSLKFDKANIIKNTYEEGEPEAPAVSDTTVYSAAKTDTLLGTKQNTITTGAGLAFGTGADAAKLSVNLDTVAETETKVVMTAAERTKLGKALTYDANITGTPEDGETPAETITAETKVYSVAATDAKIANAIDTAGQNYVTAVAASADTADDGTIAVTKNGETNNVAVKGWANKANVALDNLSDAGQAVIDTRADSRIDTLVGHAAKEATATTEAVEASGLFATVDANTANITANRNMFEDKTGETGGKLTVAESIQKRIDNGNGTVDANTKVYSTGMVDNAVSGAVSDANDYTDGKFNTLAAARADDATAMVHGSQIADGTITHAQIAEGQIYYSNLSQGVKDKFTAAENGIAKNKAAIEAHDALFENEVDPDTQEVTGKKTVAQSIQDALNNDEQNIVAADITADTLTLPNASSSTAAENLTVSGIKTTVAANPEDDTSNYLVTSDGVAGIIGVNTDGTLQFVEAEGVQNIAKGDGTKTAPTTVAGAISNLSSALGKIHGLANENGSVNNAASIFKDGKIASTVEGVTAEYGTNLKPGTSVEDLEVSLDNAIGKIQTGETVVGKAYADQNGKIIDTTYAKLNDDVIFNTVTATTGITTPRLTLGGNTVTAIKTDAITSGGLTTALATSRAVDLTIKLKAQDATYSPDGTAVNTAAATTINGAILANDLVSSANKAFLGELTLEDNWANIDSLKNSDNTTPTTVAKAIQNVGNYIDNMGDDFVKTTGNQGVAGVKNFSDGITTAKLSIGGSAEITGVDDAPTSGSNNLLSSGTIYSQLQGKQDTINATNTLNGAYLTGGTVSLDKLATTDLSQYDNSVSKFVKEDALASYALTDNVYSKVYTDSTFLKIATAQSTYTKISDFNAFKDTVYSKTYTDSTFLKIAVADEKYATAAQGAKADTALQTTDIQNTIRAATAAEDDVIVSERAIANALANKLGSDALDDYTVKTADASEFITDVNGKISVKEIAQSKITGLTEDLAKKANAADYKIKTAGSEFAVDVDGNLSVASIAASKISGLATVATSGKATDLVDWETATANFLTEHQSLADYAKTADVVAKASLADTSLDIDAKTLKVMGKDVLTTDSELNGAKLANGSVDTAALANGAVTTEKLSDSLNAEIAKIADKADASKVYNKEYIDGALNAKADKSALADYAKTTDVYGKDAVDSKLALKANVADVYGKAAVDSALAQKADKNDVYNKEYINGALDQKANKSEVVAKTDIVQTIAATGGAADKVASEAAIVTALAGKQDTIDADHKLNVDYINFSESQTAALNSGIKAEDVAQIGKIGNLTQLPADALTNGTTTPDTLVQAITNLDTALNDKISHATDGIEAADHNWTGKNTFAQKVDFDAGIDVEGGITTDTIKTDSLTIGDATVSSIDKGATAVAVGAGDATKLATTATVMKSAQNAEFSAATGETLPASLNGAGTIHSAIVNVAKAADDNAKAIGTVNFSNAKNIAATTTDLTTAAQQLDNAIGERKYTNDNVIEDGESVAESLDKIDTAMGKLSDITSGYAKGDADAAPANLAAAIQNVATKAAAVDGDLNFTEAFTKGADEAVPTDLTTAIQNVAKNAADAIDGAVDEAKKYTDDRIDGTGKDSTVTVGSNAGQVIIGKTQDNDGELEILSGIAINNDWNNREIEIATQHGNHVVGADFTAEDETISLMASNKKNENATGIEIDNKNQTITLGSANAVTGDAYELEINAKAGTTTIGTGEEGENVEIGKGTIVADSSIIAGTVDENGALEEGVQMTKDGDLTATNSALIGSKDDEGNVTGVELTADGDITASGDATVKGDLSAADGNFTVTTSTEGEGDEATSTTTMALNGDANISGKATFGDATDATKSVTIDEGTVTANEVDTKSLTADNGTFNETLTVGTADKGVSMNKDGELTATNSALIGSKDEQGNVTGVELTADGDITASGDATIAGNLSAAGGNFTVTTTTEGEGDEATSTTTMTLDGDADITGDTSIGGTLDVTGKTTLSAENGMSFGEGQTVTSIDNGSEAKTMPEDTTTEDPNKSALATVATVLKSAENAAYTGTKSTEGNTLATGTAATLKEALSNVNAFIGKSENLSHNAFNTDDEEAPTDLTGKINTLATNVAAGMGGAFDENGKWSTTLDNTWTPAEATDETEAESYYSSIEADSLADAINVVYSTIGNADAIKQVAYNGVSADNTVNDNIAAVNGKIGNFEDLHTELKNLTNGTDVAPETVVEAFNNIDATLGRIHGLFDGKKVNTTGGIESTTGSHSNLAEGTTVEMHLVSLDNAIGDRSSITNENGSNGYELVERSSVADVLSDIASQIGTADELKGATINGVNSDNTVNANIAAINSSLGNIEELKEAAFAQGDTLVDAVKNVDNKLVNLDTRLTKTEKSLKELHHDFRRGMASMAAMSALVPNSRSTGKTSLSIGTGAYGGHGAVAVGGFHYITDNLMLNAGVSWSDSSDAAYRMGVTYSF